jgi:hypothetical protein
MTRKVSLQRKHQPTSVPQSGRHPARERASIGPQLGFAAAILLSFVALSTARVTLPPDAVMPAISTLVLVLAAAFGLIAWRARATDPNNVTYVDVAGALTLIGLCAAATIDPDQMVRLVSSHHAID